LWVLNKPLVVLAFAVITSENGLIPSFFGAAAGVADGTAGVAPLVVFGFF
jgi:hypothetical protein